ncbi:MAG: helix-turn-helix transcriptional regulator [Clostridia bacterium]|nr:helix-turn-helix transcriptional regulator [Clostridia bacterium]
MFSKKFVELLQKYGISAYSVAKNTGISQGLMNEYKNGIKEPTINNLIKIADYLNCSVDYLLSRNEADITNQIPSHILDEYYRFINNFIDYINSFCLPIITTLDYKKNKIEHEEISRKLKSYSNQLKNLSALLPDMWDLLETFPSRKNIQEAASHITGLSNTIMIPHDNSHTINHLRDIESLLKIKFNSLLDTIFNKLDKIGQEKTFEYIYSLMGNGNGYEIAAFGGERTKGVPPKRKPEIT